MSDEKEKPTLSLYDEKKNLLTPIGEVDNINLKKPGSEIVTAKTIKGCGYVDVSHDLNGKRIAMPCIRGRIYIGGKTGPGGMLWDYKRCPRCHGAGFILKPEDVKVIRGR